MTQHRISPRHRIAPTLPAAAPSRILDAAVLAAIIGFPVGATLLLIDLILL